MSWHFSRALVEGCSAHISLDYVQYALSSEMSTVDLFSPSDKTTGIFQHSRFGMTFARLPEEDGEELLTSYLVGFHANHFRPPAEVAEQQWTSGPRCPGLWAMSVQPMCSPRMSPVPLLSARPKIAPRWATKPKCFPLARQTWVQTTFGSDIGYLHTPTTKANYAATSMQKWRVAQNFTRVFGRPTPGIQEWMMGWPEGWSDTKPLAMGKYQSWLRLLYGHWQILINRVVEEAQ